MNDIVQWVGNKMTELAGSNDCPQNDRLSSSLRLESVVGGATSTGELAWCKEISVNIPDLLLQLPSNSDHWPTAHRWHFKFNMLLPSSIISFYDDGPGSPFKTWSTLICSSTM